MLPGLRTNSTNSCVILGVCNYGSVDFAICPRYNDIVSTDRIEEEDKL